MGAWGHGVLENDAALDAKYMWEDLIEGRGLSPEEANKHMFKRWGESIKYGDFITNSEVIAWLSINLENGIPISKRLKDAAIDALNLELIPEELAEWAEPEARRGELENQRSGKKRTRNDGSLVRRTDVWHLKRAVHRICKVYRKTKWLNQR